MVRLLTRRQFLGITATIGGLVGAQAFVTRPTRAAEPKTARRLSLVIGVKDNRRPLGFRDEVGRLIGLEIDLAHRLATELGIVDPRRVTLQPLSNAERLTAVAEGQVDLAIAGITATDVRRRLVTFSEPYYLDSTALITQNSQLTTLAQAAQAEIGILEGSSAIATVRSILPQARLVGLPSYAAAQAFLTEYPTAAFAGDASVLTGWLQTDDRYRLVPALLSAEPLAIAMPKGLQHDALHRQVNQALQQWAATGWLQERLAYWQLP